MKHFWKVASLSIIAGSILMISCKKETETPADVIVPVPSKAAVSLQFSNEVDGTPIAFGNLDYVNPSGETFSVTTLKYYVSHASLVDANGMEVALNEHNLIDQGNPDSWNFMMANIPNGNYTTLRLHIGVEEEHNHSGDQTGALDPINGMIWTWNTGYIFFKHEGQFVHTNNSTQALTYHYGTDQAYATVDIPISFELKGVDKTIKVVFNLNDLYRSPTMIEFSGNNMHQSTSANDIPWLNAMKENFGYSFSAVVVN